MLFFQNILFCVGMFISMLIGVNSLHAVATITNKTNDPLTVKVSYPVITWKYSKTTPIDPNQTVTITDPANFSRIEVSDDYMRVADIYVNPSDKTATTSKATILIEKQNSNVQVTIQ
jgi:hypothetical protein